MADQTATTTERRPGLQALCEQVLRANPGWSRERALAQAKHLWTEQHPTAPDKSDQGDPA